MVRVIYKVLWLYVKKLDENLREHGAPRLLVDLKRPLSILKHFVFLKKLAISHVVPRHEYIDIQNNSIQTCM